MILDIKKTVINKISKEFKNCEYVEEINQEAAKPCFFIRMFPTAFEIINKHFEQQCIGVEVIYYPEKLNQDNLISVMLKLKDLFLYTPLEINGQRLIPAEMNFEDSEKSLTAKWTYSFCTLYNLTGK